MNHGWTDGDLVQPAAADRDEHTTALGLTIQAQILDLRATAAGRACVCS